MSGGTSAPARGRRAQAPVSAARRFSIRLERGGIASGVARGIVARPRGGCAAVAVVAAATAGRRGGASRGAVAGDFAGRLVGRGRGLIVGAALRGRRFATAVRGRLGRTGFIAGRRGLRGQRSRGAVLSGAVGCRAFFAFSLRLGGLVLRGRCAAAGIVGAAAGFGRGLAGGAVLVVL